MTDSPLVHGNPTDELLRWLDELERADSYAGFTLNEWLTRKPVAAIQALRARAGEPANG